MPLGQTAEITAILLDGVPTLSVLITGWGLEPKKFIILYGERCDGEVQGAIGASKNFFLFENLLGT